ncbi:hydrogenase maturation protease [Desulfurobacterium pacificum]|jgi:hydrogenase maturation protease|uniref:Hydrogenase maturation protease n=1 Tax=Desulfurobacterium pacificum TaxID=240166 RepID=A0ABY1NBQ8_9BACT|nr:HyaD/HybD family hydrogenase maturation endopeptidase [Desulfurobacterium pacificum]SMP05879.1 hydrogenase maturation protease [Desulfurobacterium pacificum]
MEKIGIMGVGNILLSDEGFGVKLLYLLKAKYEFPENVVLIDGGTAGIFLSPEIDYLSKLLIIDVVKAEGKPGDIKVYEKEDFFIDRLPLKLSPHQLGLQEVLLLNEIKGTCPEEVKLVGVIPKSLDAGTYLTPELEAKLPEVERIVLDILREWGVNFREKENPEDPNIWWEKKVSEVQ